MPLRDAVSPNNALRAWSRRLFFGIRSRPDVQIGQLERRLQILESVLDLETLASSRVRELVDLLRPSQSEDLPLSRIGSVNDGGYVLPLDLILATGGVVSIGVGDNNDADVFFARRGIPVQAWDHTVGSLPVSHPLISFHRQGLGDSPPLLKTLDDITESSFPRKSRPLTLLLDVEGAEWSALENVSPETLDRFSVISAELHDLGNLLVEPEPILPVLRRIRERFIPIAVHANNYMPTWDLANVRVPDALEVTFVHCELVDGSTLRDGNCNLSLFSPCCPDLPDVELPWAHAGP